MPILTYHHVGECPSANDPHAGLWVPPAAFEHQIQWLRDHQYQTIGFEELARALRNGGSLPRRWVIITFDDGFKDNFTHAMPVLQYAGYRATVFLTTGQLRTEADPGDRPQAFLSPAEMREMMAGGFEFGGHTHTHARLTKLSDEEIQRELTSSREAIEVLTGAPPRWFAYPYGSWSPRVARLVREAGYEAAASTIRDNRVRADQLFWLPRVMVMNDTSVLRLRYMLSPLYHLVHAYKNARRWKSR